MSETVPLVSYLFTRLRQLGIKSVHGVPGDYNLVSLDYIEEAGLEWVGDANELNAGYSADGYARVKGIGAVMTTFGVGELSAINAIAGSFAEYVPVVHIAGSPSTASQRDHMLLHHTLGNGDFTVFANCYKQVTIAQANLHDINTAASEVDQVLATCWIKSRPVYIELPTDMVTRHVDASPLEKPLPLTVADNDESTEDAAAQDILSRLYAAKQPVLLIDGCVSRHRLASEVTEFVKKTNLPTFTTPMGKGTIDETLPNFAGVYAGNGSHDVVREFVEQSDMVLSIGSIKSDFNTTGFTYRLSTLNAIDVHTEFTTVEEKRYDVGMSGLIKRLTSEVELSKVTIVAHPSDKIARTNDLPSVNYPAGTITHDWLWPTLSTWLQPDDILVTETGTSYLGVWDTTFPSNVFGLSQTLWGSIGYTLPAAQGAALAARELNRPGRVILFEGDGSFQLTMQAIATMLKHNIDIIIILINNDGYTIERYVHGMTAKYNDVPMLRYAMIPEAFGGKIGVSAHPLQIRTTEEMEAFWKNDTVKNKKGTGMHFVEMFMPQDDAPVTLKMVCSAAAKTNEA